MLSFKVSIGLFMWDYEVKELILDVVQGDIDSEWLKPVSPPDLLDNPEDRVNFVLRKKLNTRALSKKEMVIRSLDFP